MQRRVSSAFVALVVILFGACEDEVVAPTDAGPFDANEIPFDAAECEDVGTRPLAPHLTPACGDDTLACLQGCRPGTGFTRCYDACIAADPDGTGCFRCIQINANYCYVTRGCGAAWAALDCCEAWPECRESDNVDACAEDRCPDEWMYFARCASPLQREFVCEDLIQTCFP
ncbi:MAG: hypothetical protein IT379_04625 [Deltaproteobacteria bacterium]|nr:hypothetical protein [Deltaproteobacteria bacterium]